jgi:hypothetical protein
MRLVDTTYSFSRDNFRNTVSGFHKEMRKDEIAARDYWRSGSKSAAFGTMPELARMYMSVAPTSTHSERTYSRASFLDDCRRQQLHPERLGRMVVIAMWIKYLERRFGARDAAAAVVETLSAWIVARRSRSSSDEDD